MSLLVLLLTDQLTTVWGEWCCMKGFKSTVGQKRETWWPTAGPGLLWKLAHEQTWIRNVRCFVRMQRHSGFQRTVTKFAVHGNGQGQPVQSRTQGTEDNLGKRLHKVARRATRRRYSRGGPWTDHCSARSLLHSAEDDIQWTRWLTFEFSLYISVAANVFQCYVHVKMCSRHWRFNSNQKRVKGRSSIYQSFFNC